MVDVNIHPRKEEVEFLHPRSVELLVQEAVKNALESCITKIEASPQHHQPYVTPAGLLPDGSIQRLGYQKPFSTFVPTSTVAPEFFTSRHMQAAAQEPMFSNPTADTQTYAVSAQEELFADDTHSTSCVIGQYAKTYILVEHQENLLVIDQHAAHERILYEHYVRNFSTVATVRLIVPEIITLARDQILTLRPYLALLGDHGFGIDIVAEDQLALTVTPVHSKNICVRELIKQCISWVEEYQSYAAHECKDKLHHHLRAQMACKAAVKAGDHLSTQEMTELVKNLEKTPNKLTCPHGRPTSWVVSLYEFEKKFKRKS